MDPTDGKCNISKPFDGADGEIHYVTRGYWEGEDLSVFDGQIDVHHGGHKQVSFQSKCEFRNR
jgi:hypothetical protein